MALFSIDIDNLQGLFVEQLRDLYDGEQQITEALPNMIEKASNPQLRQGLSKHLDETRMQIQRLEQIFKGLNEKPTGATCKGMKGIIKEGEDLVSNGNNTGVIDASIIASAQRVEHYEIAGYGTVRTYAQQLGMNDFAALLQQTLEEEKSADALLTQVAGTANIEAKKVA